MDIELNVGWLTAVLLIATRFAGLFAMLPVLRLSSLPPQVRVLFVLGLAVTVSLALPIQPITFGGMGGLVLAEASELLMGAWLALGVHAAMAALSFAGQLLDAQIGFSAAALFDYNTNAHNPLISIFLGMVGALLFLLFDAHHEVIRALASTLDAYPPGRATTDFDPAELIRLFGLIFIYGIAIAGPVALGLFLLDGATAFVSRTMPQLNVYFLALPLKVFMGLLLLVATLVHLGPLVRQLFEQSLPLSPVRG